MLPWELQEAEEALIAYIEETAEQAGASSPMLQADDFPSFYANFESLRQLTFNGVELNLPLKSDADGEGGERYSVDEYLGTAWGAGDAVIKDEVADFFFCKALAHFLDSRYRKNKGAPRQGGAAAGHQTPDSAGVAASKLVTAMGKVFDLRKLVVPLDSAGESAADAALATIHAHERRLRAAPSWQPSACWRPSSWSFAAASWLQPPQRRITCATWWRSSAAAPRWRWTKAAGSGRMAASSPAP